MCFHNIYQMHVGLGFKDRADHAPADLEAASKDVVELKEKVDPMRVGDLERDL